MLKILKKSIFFILTAVLALALTACGDIYRDQNISYYTTHNITTLDPQIARTPAELTVIKNVFEGLMTTNAQGDIVYGMAESVTVCAAGLTHTFRIRGGQLWSDGETAVTADDFALGLERVLRPETGSPFAELLYGIVNAPEVHSGELPPEELGIEAQGNTLTITLTEPDENFSALLALPFTSPCNREFFENTRGRYGRTSQHILTNGAYRVGRFDTENNTIRLNRCPQYSGIVEAVPNSIFIRWSSERERIIGRFDNNELDVGDVEAAFINSLQERGNTTELFYNTNYVMYTARDLRSESGRRIAPILFMDLDYDIVLSNLGEHYLQAYGIIPPSNTVDGRDYRELVSRIDLDIFGSEQEREELRQYAAGEGNLGSITLYYPAGDENIELLANIIVQGWQRHLNAHINTSEATLGDIQRGVRSGDIQLAIFPVSSTGNTAGETINNLADLGLASSVDNSNYRAIFRRESRLVNDFVIYPLFSAPTAVSHSSRISGLRFSKDGSVIDFRFVQKGR